MVSSMPLLQIDNTDILACKKMKERMRLKVAREAKQLREIAETMDTKMIPQVANLIDLSEPIQEPVYFDIKTLEPIKEEKITKSIDLSVEPIRNTVSPIFTKYESSPISVSSGDNTLYSPSITLSPMGILNRQKSIPNLKDLENIDIKEFLPRLPTKGSARKAPKKGKGLKDTLESKVFPGKFYMKHHEEPLFKKAVKEVSQSSSRGSPLSKSNKTEVYKVLREANAKYLELKDKQKKNPPEIQVVHFAPVAVPRFQDADTVEIKKTKKGKGLKRKKLDKYI